MGLLYRNSVLWAGKVCSARKVLVKFDLPEPKVNQWSQAWWLAYYPSLRSSYRQMPGAPWPVSLAYLSELQVKEKPFSKNKNKKTKVGDIWEMIIETGLWLPHACAHLWTHTDLCVHRAYVEDNWFCVSDFLGEHRVQHLNSLSP